jgi:hypothetical protein
MALVTISVKPLETIVARFEDTSSVVIKRTTRNCCKIVWPSKQFPTIVVKIGVS